MGCYIHLHVEVRRNGKWIYHSHPEVDRSYFLFGIMAGVRGNGPAVVEPRGLPVDVTDTTQMYWDSIVGDAHTPSWLNEHEIAMVRDILRKKCNDQGIDGHNAILEDGFMRGAYGGCDVFGENLSQFHDGVDGYCPDGVDAIRVVFWFDN